MKKPLYKNKYIYRLILFIYRIFPDKIAVHIQYLVKNKRILHLNNPQRFTEKLQWYKIYYRNNLMTICSDKYRIRKYLTKKGFSDYAPRLLAVGDSLNKIDFNKLPDSFVIKSNNGSGSNYFVKNKDSIDYNELEKNVREWKKPSTVILGREWAYKNIEPKLIVEEYLIDEKTKDSGLNDYKFLCFNGEVKVIWVDTSRYINHARDFFDVEWNRIPVISDVPNSKIKIDKPKEFERMISISREIAEDFPFVRVDFYSVNDVLYIGELTFYPWSGAVRFFPDQFDYTLGSYFNLPEKMEDY